MPGKRCGGEGGSRVQTNFFAPQQKLVEETRQGAKVTKRYDTARTPHQRVAADARVPKKIKTGLDREYRQLNPRPAPPRHPPPRRPAPRAGQHQASGSSGAGAATHRHAGIFTRVNEDPHAGILT